MYFLPIFLSPMALFSRNREKGICDIENRTTNDNVSLDRIHHINNVSELILFYKSPNVFSFDKLDRIENDSNTSLGFFIRKGGLFDDFEFDFTLLFL